MAEVDKLLEMIQAVGELVEAGATLTPDGLIAVDPRKLTPAQLEVLNRVASTKRMVLRCKGIGSYEKMMEQIRASYEDCLEKARSLGLTEVGVDIQGTIKLDSVEKSPQPPDLKTTHGVMRAMAEGRFRPISDQDKQMLGVYSPTAQVFECECEDAITTAYIYKSYTRVNTIDLKTGESATFDIRH